MSDRSAIFLGKRPAAGLEDDVRAGRHPRVEYLELARRIGAEVVDYNAVDASHSRSVRWLARWVGDKWGLARLGALRRHELRDIYATGEDVGLPLGLMLLGRRHRVRLTIVVHNADTPERRHVFRAFRILGSGFTRLICLGSAQERILTEVIGIPPEKVHFLFNWIDQLYYRPQAADLGDYALSVGIENRDYPTLQAAATGLPGRFHVVASGFSQGAGFAPASGIVARANVTAGTGYTSTELRSLYAGARLIIVPLHAVTPAAGVTAILEAMAMGKAVIASDSPGIRDYVKDGVSGRLVPVGDAASLRRAIVELWNDVPQIEAMGRHNREWIEREINTDRYVDQVSRLMGYA